MFTNFRKSCKITVQLIKYVSQFVKMPLLTLSNEFFLVMVHCNQTCPMSLPPQFLK